jgi:ribosomal protein S17E
MTGIPHYKLYIRYIYLVHRLNISNNLYLYNSFTPNDCYIYEDSVDYDTDNVTFPSDSDCNSDIIQVTDDNYPEYKAKCDSLSKLILSNKYVLAWILKSVVNEYATIPVEYIAENYIDPSVSIGDTVIDYPTSSIITGINTESNDPINGKRTFDLLFNSIIPIDNGYTKIIVDIEPQNDFYPGYSINTRGIYYIARLISGQYEREFSDDNFDNIKKVYSIWICTMPSKAASNSIVSYTLTKNNRIGNSADPVTSYDKMELVKICLGGEMYNNMQNYEGILKLLDIIFVSNMKQEERRKILEEEFNIPITDETEKEVKDMCDVSTALVRYGEMRGEAKGLAEGESKLALLIQYLLKDMRFAELDLVASDKEFREQLYSEYKIR